MLMFYLHCHNIQSIAVAKLKKNTRHSLFFAVSLSKQQQLPYLPIIFTILLHCCKVLSMPPLFQRNRKGLRHFLSITGISKISESLFDTREGSAGSRAYSALQLLPLCFFLSTECIYYRKEPQNNLR